MSKTKQDCPIRRDMDDYLKSANSQALSAHVVVYRFLGINEPLAISCMKELLIRANAGDTFDFEKYIKQEIEKLPKSNLKIPKIDMSKWIR